MSTFRLARTKQCKTCPWKAGASPSIDIAPYGYSLQKHKALISTISQSPLDFLFTDGPLRTMSCHHSTEGNEQHCVGWLHNQLGPGNNVGLRLWWRKVENAGELKVDGPQHETFEDTLPKTTPTNMNCSICTYWTPQYGCKHYGPDPDFKTPDPDAAAKALREEQARKDEAALSAFETKRMARFRPYRGR